MRRLLLAGAFVLAASAAVPEPPSESRYRLGRILVVKKISSSAPVRPPRVIAKDSKIQRRLLDVAMALCPDIMGAPFHGKSADRPIITTLDAYIGELRHPADRLRVKRDLGGFEAVIYRSLSRSRLDDVSPPNHAYFPPRLLGSHNDFDPPPDYTMRLGRLFVRERRVPFASATTIVVAVSEKKRKEICLDAKGLFPEYIGSEVDCSQSFGNHSFSFRASEEYLSQNKRAYPAMYKRRQKELSRDLPGYDAVVYHLEP